MVDILLMFFLVGFILDLGIDAGHSLYQSICRRLSVKKENAADDDDVSSRS